jgi:hypothetical protein
VGILKSEMPPEVGVWIFKISMLLVQVFLFVILGTPRYHTKFLKRKIKSELSFMVANTFGQENYPLCKKLYLFF